MKKKNKKIDRVRVEPELVSLDYILEKEAELEDELEEFQQFDEYPYYSELDFNYDRDTQYEPGQDTGLGEEFEE